MRLWNSAGKFLVAASALTAWLCASGYAQAQQQPAAGGAKALTVERIYSQPSLSGRMTRGLEWMPDGKQLSYFETSGTGKESKTELWVIDAAKGGRKQLLAADKLESALPQSEEGNRSQATGLGRRPAAEYQWAPDGSAILFQGATALAWFDMKTQTARTLASGKARLADPKISPDGKFVSFVREHNLWAVSVADGKERAITQGGTEDLRKGELDWVYPEELGNKTAYWWSPDSASVAYFEMDESKVSKYPLVDFESYDGEADLERYPVAGGTNPIVHVFVVSVDGGEARQMDTGAETDVYLPRVQWLMDSKRLAIEKMNRAQDALDLLLADAATGSAYVVLSEKDPYWLNVGDWVNVGDGLGLLKDGKRFLWASERSGYKHLYIYDFEGKRLAQVTSGEWEVASVDAVDESKGMIYFTATEKSPLERHLYSVRMDGSKFTRVTKEPGTHAINFAPNAAAYIDTFSNAMNPPRQDLYRADGAMIVTINENRVAELSGYRLSPVEFFTVKSHDGVTLNAMMIKPPDFHSEKKYPVLVYTYGGPHVQVVRNAWGGANFLWHEMMAEKGFIIFSLDNRGSAGRGHAFESSIHNHLGAQELADQRDGAAYLKSLPYVDSARIGIWGWSYGGHMTLHAMFEDPEDFKAGFAGGPVTDWRFYDSIYTERYMGLLPEHVQDYQDASPVSHAKQLQGKLMIAHGTGDDNVHFANTLSVVDALIAAGKYAEVLPFPGRGHGVSDPPARKVLMQRVMQFFVDNL
jgi:dipeptidyl-peptidase-4